MERFDAIFLGFGKGAKTLAATLAAKGEKVAVVEESKTMYGGTCINVGCIPTKSMVNSALAAQIAGAADWDARRAHYRAASAEKTRLTTALRGKNYQKLAGNPNVTVVDGKGSFVDARTIRVEADGAVRVLAGDKIFINTGSTSYVPPIVGLTESKRVYTSDTLLNLTELPKRLVIIGGGYIGLEFASYFSNFGSKVTVLQNDGVFLGREDREVAAEILKVLSDKIEFKFLAETLYVEDRAEETVLRLNENGVEGEIAADAVLVATGRTPNLAGLNLEAAGIETQRGAVKTDDRLRTTADKVWAMGDCKGGLMFTYISLDDYRIVKSDLEGGIRTTKNRGAVPYCSFIDPPFARIGLTEDEARSAGYDVAVSKLAAAAIPKAQVLKKPAGLLKAVVDRSNGMILGASIFAEEAYETINIVKTAMDAGLPFTVLRDQIFTHPTMSEALNDLFSIEI